MHKTSVGIKSPIKRDGIHMKQLKGKAGYGKVQDFQKKSRKTGNKIEVFLFFFQLRALCYFFLNLQQSNN